ncbi:Dihydroxyacetone kinase [Drechslerella dactyloides]|uniref:Dihydroxyacetone kinase n=1 Tax=Drechslerella dactyloides TaxID=74499 RepID=A0AAD6IW06_DREDA|nr:Dihydroxyacetone kinase [Drechslerella dactyloides]
MRFPPHERTLSNQSDNRIKMSTKHFFHEYDGLVVKSLRGLCHANPSLSLLPQHKVIYNSAHEPSKVAIVSGGGSGHEPAWSGYVGAGMLAAAVNGDIFGSPSAAQVLAGIDSVKSEKGTILVITNYTGDKLHFGLACEKARAKGMEVAVLAVTDDVALGRKRAGMVGRRGLAGNVLGLKILGAAAEAGCGFEECLAVGRAVNANLVTVGASLDHCHVLGRINHEKVPDDVCVLGMGIHNEPGLLHIAPLPTPGSLVKQMLEFLLDPNDEDRAFVDFGQGDEVALLMNNFGGTSLLELQALADEAIVQLKMTWSISPTRTFCGTFETSLNGPGFSISLLNISGAGREGKTTAAVITRLLDAPTDAPAWPRVSHATPRIALPSNNTNGIYTNGTSKDVTLPGDRQLDPTLMYDAVKRACERAIASEPDLTTWDMEMGDGDCGESVKAVCQSILHSLPPPQSASPSLVTLLSLLANSIDAMGGTLGAIFGIFLASFTAAVQRQPPDLDGATLFANAAYDALQGLKSHSGARVGDRTVMDTLIPFCEAFKASGSFESAVEAGMKGAEGTRGMKARFGRATYVKGREGYVEPPDPGAWAVREMFLGALEVIEGRQH